VLQTEANYLARSMELQAAIDEEKTAARAFNTMRGMDTDMVEEKINFVEDKMVKALVIPARVPLREDVKAAEAQKRLAEANARLGREKNKPNVSVFGTYGLNGRDVESGVAISESRGWEHPNYTVGLRVD